MFGADAYGSYGFLPSAINRADAPTRDREIEGPDLDLPRWWGALAEGDVTGFDDWLQGLAEVYPAAKDPYDYLVQRHLLWLRVGGV